MEQLKYIIIDTKGWPEVIIFTNSIEHRQMMINMNASKEQVRSAGFLQLTTAGARCYGSSTSLGIGSDPAVDNALINRMGGDNVD